MALLSSCGSAPHKDRTKLLWEEVQKENSPSSIEKVDSDSLWEPAQIEKRWIPDQFKGNRLYIPGHYEYIVISPGHWKSK